MKFKIFYTFLFSLVCYIAMGQLSSIKGANKVYTDEEILYLLEFDGKLTTDTRFVISIENGVFAGTNQNAISVNVKKGSPDFEFTIKWQNTPGSGKIISYKFEDSKKIELDVTIAKRIDQTGLMIKGPDIIQYNKTGDYSLFDTNDPTTYAINPLWEVDNKTLLGIQGSPNQNNVKIIAKGISGYAQVKLMIRDSQGNTIKTLNKTVEVVPGYISGNNFLCGDGTYSINGMPAGATMNWSVTNNKLIIVSGQGSSSIKVSAVAGASGAEKIKLTYVYKGQTFYCELNIEVGNPPVVRNISGPTSVPLDIAESYQVDSYINSNEGVFIWQITPSDGAELMPPNGNTCTITFRKPGTYMLTCMVKSNTCGYQTNPVPPVLAISVVSYYRVSQSDNTRILTISQPSSVGKRSIQKPINYSLNSVTTGLLVAKGYIYPDSDTIDLNNIPSGIYALIIETEGRQKETHKLIIK